MRKGYLWILVSLVVMLMMVSTVQAQSSRITFSSDRSGEGDERDLWKMKDDGTNQIAVTELDYEAHNPSIGQGGYKVFFDYYDGKIYMGDFTDVEEDVVALFDGWDPASLKLADYPLGGGRERLLWTADYDEDGDWEIYMGVLDVEDEVLEAAAIRMTPSTSSADHTQPAFCGDDHFIWRKYTNYGGGLCYQRFDNDGPVDDPTCRFVGTEVGGGLIDQDPTCNPAGTEIAWAREIGWEEGTLQIFKVSVQNWLDGDLDDDELELDQRSDDTHGNDARMPAWSPSGSQIAFASNLNERVV